MDGGVGNYNAMRPGKARRRRLWVVEVRGVSATFLSDCTGWIGKRRKNGAAQGQQKD